MTTDRWQFVSRLYHEALTREAGERAAFLCEACQGDATLQQEIESLLTQASAAERFLASGTGGRDLGSTLGKIASAGQNGQFRTPRHIIQLMVEMIAPGPKDVICDPACGTAGFLVAAGEYLRKHHPSMCERIARLKKRHGQSLADELRVIGERVAAMPILDPRTSEEILDHDDRGLAPLMVLTTLVNSPF